MSNQLLPCPFCGIDVEREQHQDDCYFVVDRIAKTHAQLGDFSRDPAVYEAWNRRATQPAAGEPEYQWREDDSQRWWTTSKADYEWILGNRPSYQARILWTAQPAAAPVAAGEPVAWKRPGGSVICDALKKAPGPEWKAIAESHTVPLYTAPPAAAHGDEAVRKDAARYQWLRKKSNGLALVLVANHCVNELDAEIDAAMRAQGDGEMQ